MTLLKVTVKRLGVGKTAKRSVFRETARRSSQYARPLVAALLAMMIAAGPVPQGLAQEPAQNPPAQPSATPSTAPVTPVSLGLAKHNFSRAPRAFPKLIDPYKPIKIEEPLLTNSPRIDQLIHDGKLEIKLQDAVELALENSLDIVVQRYNPWIADTDILRTMGGGAGRGLSGTGTASVLGNIPSLNFDPQVTASISYDDRSTPINNPFISGTGTSSLTSLVTHTATYNTQYSQGFATGTGFFTSYNNIRSSSTSSANLFNPSVQSSLFVGFSQELLNGFGLLPNTRNIRIAKNTRKIADWLFTQQAITTVTNTITAYWELVFARENVKVQQQAVTVADKLYNDNRKQLEIGTMAPLDVTRAESELATDRQNLIVAQTAKLQLEQVLKNDIAKNPLAPNLINVEIIPTDLPTRPEAVEAPSFEEAVTEAFAKRPDLQQQVLNLQNGDIEVRATRNALLPTATLVAQYGTVGLGGNQVLLGAAGRKSGGYGDASSQVFHNNFPDYSVSVSVSVPLRNRQAQADNQRAILTHRQLEAQMQQLKNAALLDVRTTYIALEQDRGRVEAAAKARELQQQTFDAERKKYELGASTVFLVIQTQRDLILAQGTELRSLADLVEAKANYERAVGRTLEVNHVTIADAKSGEADRDTLIPGTLHGQVVGTEKLFNPGGQR
ncbi:MAG TPA: TolC family protein [Candidatus Acidoferrum sp.]|nr:TolC family protein [Candidatus Acidoferrum sp.]